MAGWKRPGVGPATLVLATIAILGLPLAGFLAVRTATAVTAAIPRLRQRPARALSDPTPGPRVVVGTLEGESQATPSGGQAVAFVAWIDRTYTTSSGGKQRTETERVCTVRHLGWTGLREGPRRVELVTPEPLAVPEPGAFPDPKVGTTLVLLPTRLRVTEPPAGLTSRPGCSPRAGGRLTYGELAVAEGTPAMVSGCLTDGVLRPCGDEVDAVVVGCIDEGGAEAPCTTAARGVAALVERWTGGVTLAVGVTLGLAGAFTAVLTAIQLLRHHRERARRRVVVR